MDTSRLIDHLARHGTPVRPLPAPWWRALIWAAVCAPYLALVVLAMSPRSDLAAKLTEWRFLVELSAALATGVAAAVAAFLSTIPGSSRRVLLLPLVPLAVWLASIGHGCLADWFRLGAAGLTVHPSWACVLESAVASAVPAGVIVFMLQRGAPIMPVATAALAALAAAGLGNFGLRLFHPQNASIMILVWQLGSVFLFVAVAASCGRKVFRWPALRHPVADHR